MNKTQATGALIIAGAALQMVIFLIGTTRRSYAALAMPVAAALAGLSALAVWVGWTMMTTEDNMEGADFEEEFAAAGYGQES